MTTTTRTSIIKAEQFARKTERVLIRVYETILKDIIRDSDYPNYPDSLRMKYYKPVYAATRKAIEEVHKDAVEYVGKTLEIETYLTTTDIETIKQETEMAVDQFFISLRRGAEVQQQHDAIEKMENMNRLLGASLLDPVYGLLTSAARNAVSFITKAFSTSVVSKTKQVGDIVMDVMVAKTGLPSRAKVRYTTAHDERVCERCNRLDGEIYDVDDPNIPEMPDDLHYNCRCYYELVQ